MKAQRQKRGRDYEKQDKYKMKEDGEREEELEMRRCREGFFKV